MALSIFFVSVKPDFIILSGTVELGLKLDRRELERIMAEHDIEDGDSPQGVCVCVCVYVCVFMPFSGRAWILSLIFSVWLR